MGLQGGRETELAQRAVAQCACFPGYRLGQARGAGLLAVWPGRTQHGAAVVWGSIWRGLAVVRQLRHFTLTVSCHQLEASRQRREGRLYLPSSISTAPTPAPSPIRPGLPSGCCPLQRAGVPWGGAVPTLLRGRASSPTVLVGGGEVGVRIRAGRRFEPKTDWWELVLDSWQRKRGMARACVFFFFLL